MLQPNPIHRRRRLLSSGPTRHGRSVRGWFAGDWLRSRQLDGGAAARDCERGAVTAELAVGFPAVVLLLVVILTLAAASGAQMRALDGARAGARAVAVGQTQVEMDQAIRRVASENAVYRLSYESGWVSVEVWQPVVGGPLARGPLRAHGQAWAWVEPRRGS